jgi:hypothetical protein
VPGSAAMAIPSKPKPGTRFNLPPLEAGNSGHPACAIWGRFREARRNT